MYTFTFTYEDKSTIVCPNISEVIYPSKDGIIKVKSDNFLTYNFDTKKQFCLHGENISYSISNNGLRGIFIENQ